MARLKSYSAIVTMLVAAWAIGACSEVADSKTAEPGARDSGIGGGGSNLKSGDAGVVGQGGSTAVITGGTPASGGAAASGGMPSAGGASAMGGATGAGGATQGGGATSAGSGNTSTSTRTGAGTGTSTSTSSGGSSGSSSSPGAGGATGTASAGGIPASAGTAASGGYVSPSGGASRGGGATSAGGASGLGGATGTGRGSGATGSGGAISSGGATRSGGGVPAADAGPSSFDGRADAGDCAFAGGSVTAAVYPGGLTLRKACSPYSVGNISIDDDGVLTVEPGVTLRFAPRTKLSVGLQGSGKLLAVGTTADSIIFTSQESLPSPGFWDGLIFNVGTVSGSKVAYAQVTAAGGNQDACIVGAANLPAGAVVFDHVTVDKVGDGADGVLVLGDNSNVAITNSTFVDIPTGRYPISVLAASFAGVGAGNTYPAGSAIEVAGGIIDTTVGWANPGIPLAITKDVMVQGTGSPVLTVGSGTTLKFGAGVALQAGRAGAGKIMLTGTAASHLTLTALADAPRAGAWAGVEIWDNGRATISYADFRYGGSNTGDSKGNLTLESGAATVQLAVDHSTFNDSAGWGIYVPCTSSGQTAIITVDAYTTYSNNALGAKGPGLIGNSCP